MPDTKAAKLALRDQLNTARRRLPLAEVGARGAAIGRHLLADDAVRRAATLTLYVSVDHEPGTGLLLDALHDAGRRVLLPVVLPGLDLDWAPYAGPGSLAPARFGLLEPVTPRLGVDAIATADVLLVPGLGVSADGVRLGQGGGCYDRALARVPAGREVTVLLYDEEVGVAVPAEDHDRRVSAAATPTGIIALGSPAAG